MGAPVLTSGSTVLCPHAGSVMLSSIEPRVKAMGQPVATLKQPDTVSACTFQVSGAPAPCVTVNWVTTATRVRAGGVPLILQNSMGLTVPNGTPVSVVNTQMRVMAT